MTSNSTVRIFFFSSRRRHTRLQGDWSSDVCSSDLAGVIHKNVQVGECLKDFAVRPSDVGFVCNIGANRNHMQHLGRVVQLLFISAGDSDACSCINENFGDSESDSAAAACDECRIVPQVHADLPMS